LWSAICPQQTWAPEELAPFSYHETFEGEKDPVGFWVSDGTYTVNFKGLTDEKAYSGKKAFKLDVEFKTGSYFYWALPLPTRVPAEGELSFSGHILVGDETTGQVGLGLNVVLPPTPHSRSRALECLGPTQGEWVAIKSDVVTYAGSLADSAMRELWRGTASDVGIYVDLVGLLLYGSPGQRVVVYVDDISLEGNVPQERKYQEAIHTRWAEYTKMTNERLASWEKALTNWELTLTEAEQEINEGTKEGDATKGAFTLLESARREIAAIQLKIGDIRNRGYMQRSEPEEFEKALARLGFILDKARAFACGASGLKDLLCYAVKPISSSMILLDTEPVPGEITHTLTATAAPGEYEPISFVLWSYKDITSLEVTATDLVKTTDAPASLGQVSVTPSLIPSSNLDIRVVKAWYQAGTAWSGIKQDRSRKVLVPELLLHDDSLVRVDPVKQANYLKVSYNGVEKYVPVSGEDDPFYGKSIISVDELPVKDSPSLLPLDIPAGTNKQLWLTIRVPDDAEPGSYVGKLEFKAGGQDLGYITLQVNVLPITLPEPPITYSIYYRGRLDPSGRGSISSELKSEKQFRAEMENLFSHGVTNPTVYQEFDPETLGRVLEIRNDVGMIGKPLFYLGVLTGNPTDAAGLQALKEKVRAVVEFTRGYGVPEVYFYGTDEARGERLASQKLAWQAVHEAGGKTFVAGFQGTFEAMGDLLDILVWSGWPDAAEARKWHGIGHKIFNYGNPQGGVENPEVYRRNFGLLLWKVGYDGAMTYAYQHSFGNIWNDFDHSTYRDHNFTYPTVDGVIDTIAWEGFREAVDDLRYVAALQKEIERAKLIDGKRELALEAENFLKDLDVNEDLDKIREEIISYILKLATD